MSTLKVAITMEENLIQRIDRLVKEHVFPNRSKAIQCAVAEKMMRMNKGRLAQECSKLDRKIERQAAEEGMESELEKWPEY